MNILISGALGYIGSHTIIELLKDKDISIIAIDNLANSVLEIKDVIEKVSKRNIEFYNIDLVDFDELDNLFQTKKIDLVIHFAALKSVGESVKKPLEYYNNNIIGTLNLLTIMKKYNIKRFIFSSSATVYGESDVMPVHEELPISVATNPYGRTKTMIEEILKDIYISDSSWNIVILRYFNPVGAHNSGLIGELPKGIPNNIMPYISKVANGELEYVNIFGNDYNTFDGTGIRDYIHVVDLAKGHIAAMKKLKGSSGFNIYNLGTGNGYSVLEIIKTFSKVSGKEIKYKFCDRRKGDVGISYANSSKAKRELGWSAEKTLEDMCRDFWRWQCTGMKFFNK